MSEPYLSQIEAFAFGFAPKGWLLCAGQLLSIQQNSALFSLLGTTYGGNGIQTFALPDLRSRVAIGFNGSYPQGAIIGEEAHTLLTSEVPPHAHSLTAVDNGTAGGTFTPSDSVSPGSPYNAVSSGGVGGYSTTTTTPTAMAPTDPNGGSTPHANTMPYNTLNYCIAINGIFPSRN